MLETPLKSGYTTGSSATAGASGALLGLLGESVSVIHLKTPSGDVVDIEIHELEATENSATCFVIKDAGDDPDVTHGARVYAKVTKNANLAKGEIFIKGGLGIGIVTKPGLDQPVGEYAINSVPRKMIKESLSDILKSHNCDFGVDVEISIPSGVELAKKTFNPKLGIVGGISVLGTSGIVNPMSDKAIVDTIAVEISQKVAMGELDILITPGNYGKTFLEGEFQLANDNSVKCSNFIGETIEILEGKKAKSFLLVGHIGKMAKLYNGTFNTHSKYGDGRREAFLSACEKSNVSEEIKAEISSAVMTDDMIDIIKRGGVFDGVMKILGDTAFEKIAEKTVLPFGLMIFSNVHGLIYKSENAKEIFDKVRKL